jgi:cation diffusion facilitator family transporter
VPAGDQSEKGGQRVVVAALLINVAIAGCKFVAAALSRSTAMLAEACHSLADTANQVFLLIGLRASSRPPDEKHPFGYGPETYFWAFMVALCIFSVGGALSIWEGVDKIAHGRDHALGDPRWAYAVLAASIALESWSFTVAMREFKHLRRGRGLRATLTEARDPTVLTVLFEDLAALFGLAVAATGIALAHATGQPAYDGAASVVVGGALVAVALVLARDAKSLLIGQSVPEGERNRIAEIAAAARDVVGVVHIRTIHLGPRDVMCGLKLRFSPTLDTLTLKQRINELEAQLRAALPHLTRIYVEPGFDERAARAARNAAEREGERA